MNIDLDQVKLLLEMVGETDISELTIEVDEERITIKKGGPGLPAPGQVIHTTHVSEHPSASVKNAVSPTPAPKAEAPNAPSTDNTDLTPITAPMVGTFYRSPSPSAPTFVEVGDKVSIGQTICIIEAMKLMNDLPSEIAGKIVKICAENGSTVEYGQQLFLVDTKG